MAILTRCLIHLGLPLLLAGTVDSVRAANPEFDEYQIKAAFLFNFAKFVEWPPSTFASDADSIGICVVGQNPFGSVLEETVRGKEVGRRGFTVRLLPDTQQVSRCQILFIGASEQRRTRALLDRVKGSSILTVGETETFADLGGIVSFRMDGARVRIEIALDAAEQAKLRISSKLLSLVEKPKR